MSYQATEEKPLVKLPPFTLVPDGPFNMKMVTAPVSKDEYLKFSKYFLISHWADYLTQFGAGTHIAVSYHHEVCPVAQVLTSPDHESLEQLIQNQGCGRIFAKGKLGKEIDSELVPFAFQIENDEE